MFKSIDKWLPGYLRSVIRRPGRVDGTRHLLFCIADHFEPFRLRAGSDGVMRKVSPAEAREFVEAWVNGYPSAVRDFRDSDGCAPHHTFFYPQEEYDPQCLDLLTKVCRDGYGEVEIHLHHRNDTAEGFREKLVSFRDLLRREHGLLGTWKGRDVERGTLNVGRRMWGGGCGEQVVGRTKDITLSSALLASDLIHSTSYVPPPTPHDSNIAYGFVHGNWALCNSRPDGDWCGVNEELGILSSTGCFADFTFPSAPSPTQPRMVNAIYRAVDTPGRPRGCDSGERAEVGRKAEGGPPEADLPPAENLSSRGGSAFGGKPETGGDASSSVGYVSDSGTQVSGLRPQPSPSSLLLITGPLGLNWRRRKWGLFPRIENGEISAGSRPSVDRVAAWVRQGIHIVGRPEWVFVKLHTHSCVDANRAVLFGEHMANVRNYMHSRYNDGKAWCLHYVSAREMFNIARAAEEGMTGNPGGYRDYEVAPPPVLQKLVERRL